MDKEQQVTCPQKSNQFSLSPTNSPCANGIYGWIQGHVFLAQRERWKVKREKTETI